MDVPISAKAALLQELSRGPGIAYELAGRLRKATGGALDLSEGSLYPALRALEKAELVEAAKEGPPAPGAKPRKPYRLTAAGAEEAEAQRRVLMAVIGMGGGTSTATPLVAAAAGPLAESDTPAELADPAPRERIVVLDDAEPEGGL